MLNTFYEIMQLANGIFGKFGLYLTFYISLTLQQSQNYDQDTFKGPVVCKPRHDLWGGVKDFVTMIYNFN